jgi:hypothetical protein
VRRKGVCYDVGRELEGRSWRPDFRPGEVRRALEIIAGDHDAEDTLTHLVSAQTIACVQIPETRYARTVDGLSVAYQVARHVGADELKGIPGTFYRRGPLNGRRVSRLFILIAELLVVPEPVIVPELVVVLGKFAECKRTPGPYGRPFEPFDVTP